MAKVLKPPQHRNAHVVNNDWLSSVSPLFGLHVWLCGGFEFAHDPWPYMATEAGDHPSPQGDSTA